MRTCFIIMPLSMPDHLLDVYAGDEEHFPHVLECLFIPAINKAGFKAILPTAQASELIQARIIENLQAADLVLCDMSAANANVFFELGIRTALDLPSVLVKDQYTHVPFDTSIVNYHQYDARLGKWSIDEEIEAVAEYVRQCKEAALHGNTLWQHFGRRAAASKLDPLDPATAANHVVLEDIQAMRRELGNLISQSETEVIRRWTRRRFMCEMASRAIRDYLSSIHQPFNITNKWKQGQIRVRIRDVEDEAIRHEITLLAEGHDVGVSIEPPPPEWSADTG